MIKKRIDRQGTLGYFCTMAKKLLFVYPLVLIMACGSPPARDCKDFKTGSFTFTPLIDGEEKQTSFHRTLNIEVDEYEGKIDSSSVRWINDCEYILKNLDPENMAEEKAIHIKILSTQDSSYTFEFGVVGDSNKFKGTAHKIGD